MNANQSLMNVTLRLRVATGRLSSAIRKAMVPFVELMNATGKLKSATGRFMVANRVLIVVIL